MVPREYIHYKNSAPGDSSWYNRFFMNYMAQDPAIFDESKSYKSAYSIQNYLVNKKGFYDAEVNYQVETKNQKSTVTYTIDPKKRYKVNAIEYLGTDKEALAVLEHARKETLIDIGDYIDAGTFDLELTRMSVAMQNEGYAKFATNYLSIKGDSSLNNHGVDIFLELIPPLPDSTHQKYTIGDINIYTDFHRDQDTSRLENGTYNNVGYHRQGSKFLVKPSSIDNAIFLKQGSVYNRDARSKTRRKLSELGTYRFVTMSARLDELQDSIINYDIFLTPFQNKWVADFGWDFFISSTSQSSNGSNQVLGFSLNNQLKNRNFLGGAEQFTFGTEIGMEIQIDSLGSNSPVRSRSIGLNAALEIPKHKNLLGLTSLLRKVGLMSEDGYQSFRENTTTTISTGYAYNDLVDNYARSSFTANYTYDYRPNKTSRFVIRQLGLEYNDYELSPIFRDRIENNPLLLRSFDDNLLTGLFFRDITYIYTQPVTAEGNSFTFITNLDVSGLEKYAINRGYNAISGSNAIWNLNNNIEFAKYFRLEIDQRFYEYFSDRHSFAARAYAGIIVPFGGSQAAPFFKQFSVGGPNSLRGWDQKELGPGGFSRLLLEPEEGQNFYQTGDIKLEANIEYRFDIFYIFEGALFMDAGNVWTLKANSDRPDANITSEFTDQIAVSAGYGIRFDFTYFNIRFDFGYKLRDPFPTGAENDYWYTWDRIKAQKLGNFQVAVNYPF